MVYQSLEEMNQFCSEKNVPLWKAVLLGDMEENGISEEESIHTMEKMWDAMLRASDDYDAGITSNSGLVGGMGGQMDSYRKKKDTLCGDFVSKVITQALQMGESNACMKRIVAAPTAGACGVIPAVLIPLFREGKSTREEILHSLYITAGIGAVIASRAFIAGASGGCQAEIGSASAMAAGALTYLKGGDNHQIMDAAAMALSNLMGLVCDPVAGLVEVPCVKRNVVGAVNALSAADMALAGITSRIPPDQVIDAMKEVGEAMNDSLRETGKGGLANTPRAKEIAENI